MTVNIERLLSFAAETLPHVLSWWVSVSFVGLGLYVLFASERSEIPLAVFGFLDVALGVFIYLTVQYPEWTPEVLTRDLLVAMVLFLLFAFVILTTWLIWVYYELERPDVRLGNILIAKLSRFRNARRKLARTLRRRR